MTKPCVYTIHAGLSFVDQMAKALRAESGDDPSILASMQLLLPTRRACRSLREAFLRESEGKPLLLPRMSPIGDVDEEELSLLLAGTEAELSLEPAIAPMHRLFLLTRLIGKMEQGRGIEQDMALARALAHLMDQVYTEDLDLKNLPHAIDREEFSQHWQISLDFLKILSENWPLVLKEQGVMDAADRRNRLLKSLALNWKNNPPAHRIIAAGSTGSIPATAELLKTVASLPDGCIVLPGLDLAMDDESWNAIQDTHPQATLKSLLKTLGVERKDVALWPGCEEPARGRTSTRAFCTEIMRPAETSAAWQKLKDTKPFDPQTLSIERYDCANPQEEALVIALALRGALEQSEETTAALVTPDRKLARRVAMACRRWGIEIDDSAGTPLAQTRAGSFIHLCTEAVEENLRPVALLSFCKHALCMPEGMARWRGDIRALDKNLFRRPAFSGGIESYHAKISLLVEEKQISENFAALMTQAINSIAGKFAALTRLSKAPFADWCEAHLQTLENFCQPHILWAGEDGEAASLFFSGLREHGAYLPDMDVRDYLGILKITMEGSAVRPKYGLHPRLSILGQLEARLVEADIMILSGLNENTWPPKPAVDPWMSRPMRRRFGLPSPERGTGLSAHDFAQCLCADKVILTRSLRVDGTPTVPSRWLQRMDTVLQACGTDTANALRGDLLDIARAIDDVKNVKPAPRPEPRPPVSSRPRRLSVTAIETWMNDPYSLYAKHILKLNRLKPLEEPLDAAMRGTLLHDILDKFVTLYPKDLPPDRNIALNAFMGIVAAEMERHAIEPDVRSFWTPRLEKTGRFLIRTEETWRQTFMPRLREIKGTMEFTGMAGPFTLSARADRIDVSRDGREAAIVDYKSGGAFSPKGMKSGQYPQLPLEALIVESNGFDDLHDRQVTALAYWILNGSGEGGKETSLIKPDDLQAAKDNARDGLQTLIDAFDDEATPYYSLPRQVAKRYNTDYDQLARVQEWSTAAEQDES